MTKLILDACDYAVADATEPDPFLSVLETLIEQSDIHILLLHRREDRDRLQILFPIRSKKINLLEVIPETPIGLISRWVFEGTPQAVAYLICAKDIAAEMLKSLHRPLGQSHLRMLLPSLEIERFKSVIFPISSTGWMAGEGLASALMSGMSTVADLQLPRLAGRLHRQYPEVQWDSMAHATETAESNPEPRYPPLLDSRSKILAVVPHFRCEEWLSQVLETLIRQTRAPEQIVVVDDHSGQPPRDIVARFSGVTLLSTPRNIGPEAILHQVMEQTDFDGYMLHDADDWSAADRLQLSLEAAEQTGAGLIATQELRFLVEESRFQGVTYPLNASRAMLAAPGHYTLYGSSLIARQLARRVGGMDASFRIAADTDFVYRASYAALAINLPQFGYFRRIRSGSLTTAHETHQRSLPRQMELVSMQERARKNLQRLRQNSPMQLHATRSAPRLDFIHEMGPQLPAARCGLTSP